MEHYKPISHDHVQTINITLNLDIISEVELNKMLWWVKNKKVPSCDDSNTELFK